jgi:antitoxin VapB
MEPADRAKVFWSGRSQAVRLPKEYRFEGHEVRIRRRGAAIILEPIPAGWRWQDELLSPGGLDADAVEAAGEQPEAQRRPQLGEVFDR